MIENIEKDSNEILETFLNNSLQAQLLINKTGDIIHMNMIAKHIMRKFFHFQVTTDKPNWLDLIAKHDNQSLIKQFELVINGEIQIKEMEFKDQTNKSVWYEFQYFPVFNKDKEINEILLTILDISELKNSQIRFNETMMLNQALLGKHPQALLIVEAESLQIEYMNSTANRIINFDDHHFSNLNLGTLFHHIIWTKKYHSIDDLRRIEINDEPIEFLDYRKKKCFLLIHTRLCLISDRSYIFFFATDISSEKNSIINLNLVQSSLEENSVGVMLTDETGEILFSNKVLDFICPRDQQNKSNQNILTCLNKENDEFIGHFIYCIRHKTNWQGQLTIIDNHNKSHVFATNISFLKNAENKIIRYIAIFKEITHEIELEKQLRQAQKLEAIGTLAGGIAHDFNNILTAIFGFTELSMMDIPEDSYLNTNLTQILSASQRAKDLIFQILTFSRHNESEFTTVKISPIIKEAFKLLRAGIPVTIQMKHHIKTNEDTVLGDPTQIHQIIMNLCSNAYYAMKDRSGQINLTLEKDFLDSSEVHPNLIKPGNYLILTISDTGCGIPPLVLDKIFDPYFTTKPKGDGTGLGLAMVHGIITSMQGFIEVQSIEEVGTTFKLFIPYIQKFQPVSLQDNVIYQGNKEKILFIDDEIAITEIMEQILTKINYLPTVTTEVDFALKLFTENPEDYNLIITDMTMPKMTGIDFTKKIRSFHPTVPIIICTGYSDLLSKEKMVEYNISDYIIKPVTIQEISKKINNVLNVSGDKKKGELNGRAAQILE